MCKRQGFLLIAIVAILNVGIGSVANAKRESDETLSELERFIQAMTLIHEDYVGPMTSHALVDLAIRGMLQGLDDQSEYLNQDSRSLESPSSGDVGLSVGAQNGHITVLSCVEGGPGWTAGIRPGDRILKLNGISTEGSYPADVSHRLRGEEGTTVELSILRGERKGPIEFSITRDVLPHKPDPYGGILRHGIRYIRLSTFPDDSSRFKLDALLTKLDKERPTGLILDLRNNLGGLVSQGVEVSEEFVPHGKEIARIRARAQVPGLNRELYSTSTRSQLGYPLVVLVNRYSAGASEIVAGAIQDLDLGVVMGQRTLGQGGIQTVALLKKGGDGPMMRLTTARIYTPSGRCILKDAGSDEGDPAPQFHTSTGRVVYGGGGIVPDLELEETYPPRIVEDMDLRQIFVRFAAKLAAEHPDSPADYALTPGQQTEFVAFLKNKEFAYDPDSLAVAQRWVDARIRSELARRYRGDEEAYRVALEDDDWVKTAVELMTRAPSLSQLFPLVSRLSKAKGETASTR